MANRPKPLLPRIFDGFGINNNAKALAAMPCWDGPQQDYPMPALDRFSDEVGSPGDQMGHPEVDHLNSIDSKSLRDSSNLADLAPTMLAIPNPDRPAERQGAR